MLWQNSYKRVDGTCDSLELKARERLSHPSSRQRETVSRVQKSSKPSSKSVSERETQQRRMALGESDEV